MIDQAFWSDPDIERQPAGVKLATLWLITNSQTSLLGICGASDSRFTFETGLPTKALAKTLEALPRAFKPFQGGVFIRNYVRHQFGTGEKLTRNNFFVALRSLFLSVKDADLKSVILDEYPEFSTCIEKGLPSPSQGLTKPKDGKVREGKKGDARGILKPSREESKEYGAEIGMDSAAVDGWYDHFESNGWKISGKTLMKDWKAALRNGKRYAPHINGNGNGVHKPGETLRAHERPQVPVVRPDGFNAWFEQQYPDKTWAEASRAVQESLVSEFRSQAK
jgi:hypothetical protein